MSLTAAEAVKVQPTQCLADLAGWSNPPSRVDFAIPAGAETIRFSEGTRCCVGRAEVAEAGSTGALVQLKCTK